MCKKCLRDKQNFIILYWYIYAECSCSDLLHIFLSQSWFTAKKMAAIKVKLLKKTDVQNFPQNACLLSRWLEFEKMNEWLWWVVLLPNISWLCRGGKVWENSNSRIFSIELIEWLRPHFYYRVTDWWQCGAGYFHEIIIWIKSFYFKKRQLFFKSLTWEFQFLILTHFRKKHSAETCELWDFPICYWRPLGFQSTPYFTTFLNYYSEM